MRNALLAVALVLVGTTSGPAAAEVRRFEVVGAVPLDPAAPPAAPRQAALRAALEEAVAHAVREVLRRRSGSEALPDPPPVAPGEPSEYAVSYRVLEDRGEQDAMLAGGQGGREYVVVAEVQIDLARVQEALGEGAAPGAEPLPAGGPARFQLELLGIPRPAAWTAIRHALARAGAESVVPLELEPGRALVAVESALGADRTLDRLIHTELPAGLGLEPLPEADGVKRLQVRVGGLPPAPPEPPVD
jgi:hypothetical protein